MGGYPNPRDCSKCICPRGYGGASCDERPQAKKCGETLTASSKANTIAYTLGNIVNTEEMEDFEECYYWIQNPGRKTIKMTIKKVEVKFSDMPESGYYTSLASGCSTGGIEIKAQKDQLLSGYRFCDPDANEGKTITSSNDIVPVIIYNRQGATEVELEYRTSMLLLFKLPQTSFEWKIFRLIKNRENAFAMLFSNTDEQ
ncbi:unnamed protein product [Cylicocyclus nassatus]|uniref:CUB domain-containing protein n=1 Tax=Cylicocyclus nassatus TaxID=53992 RepID=A0AA36MFV2_CYLNA|nr:unnamed protein product [Cylicocyclus nassatus]